MAAVVINGNANSNGAFSAGSPRTFTVTGDPAAANAGEISGYLAAGQDVLVTSTSNVFGPYNSITVIGGGAINGGMGAGSLTLDTDNTIAILASVTLLVAGSSLVLHGATGIGEPGAATSRRTSSPPPPAAT